jgi:arylsulfatase A-like enzyme
MSSLWRALGLASAAASLVSVAQAQPARPNIVVILADDQGWTDTSVQMDPNVPGSKSTYYQTPNLQELANAGMRFSNGYAAAPQCAQTRASLYTGKSPAQLQMTNLIWAGPGQNLWEFGAGFPLTPPQPEPFDATQLTIPRMVKQADPSYRTAMFGKWHLDLPASTTPTAAGFDMYGSSPNVPATDPFGVFGLTTQANNFMQQSVGTNQPFYLQLNHYAVHEAYSGATAYIPARQELITKYENIPHAGNKHNVPALAALTEDLDTAVGQVMDKITELGIEDNTYVFYVSDNGGPVRWTSNVPLKWGKATLYEGGLRIPYMVKGPGIEPGSFSDVPVMTTDLLATIGSLAGFTGPMPGVESADLTPILQNGGDLPEGVPYLDRQYAERGEVYFHFPHYQSNGRFLAFHPTSAVRDGDYKLYVEYNETGGAPRLQLYNLATDIGEAQNLATQMPQKAAELKSMLDNYLTTIDASLPYDVKAPVKLIWDASSPGVDANAWRSTNDVNYKARETWAMGGGAEKPTTVNVTPYQPGLAGAAFSFDGGDIMRRKYFHVGDHAVRRTDIVNVSVGTPDFDRSASTEVWFRASNLTHNQVLWESGDGNTGISMTLGDADANGSFNDLRFRVRGANGQALTVTVPIDSFANPVNDFVNATAVFNDSDADRFVELYVNGALAGRTIGTPGPDGSLRWDGYDQAGLGKAAGAALGANGGTGALPFNGGFTGQMAGVNFWNHAINASTIAGNYNSMLDPVSLGVLSRTGGTLVPAARPTNLTLGAAESNSLMVVEERRGTTAAALAVDKLVTGPTTISQATMGTPPQLASGTGFTSYLLHFDPTGSPATLETVTGSVTFAENIIAILFDDATLAASDKALGSIGNYGSAVDRQLPWSSGDFLTVGADQKTLSFNLSVPGDDLLQFRVVTSLVGPASVADFNDDGIVNGQDLVAWKSAFGVTPGADADGDGDTDGHDFLAWQRELGATSATLAASAVPEPAAEVLAILALAGAAWSRRSSRLGV